MSRYDKVKFVFQNTNLVYYDVEIDPLTGVGGAIKHGLAYHSRPPMAAAPTSLTVDGASLAAWQGASNSYRQVAAVYNTAQALNTILNAAS